MAPRLKGQCRRAVWLLALVAVLGSGIAVPATAQTTGGIRAGVSGEPDQFYFGGHVETPPIAEQLRFRPNVEIGIGSDVTLVALNLEFAYHFDLDRPWDVYAGAGPALNIIDTSHDTDAGGGFNMLLGLSHDSGLFFEFKAGVLDSPNVKVGVGYRLFP